MTRVARSDENRRSPRGSMNQPSSCPDPAELYRYAKGEMAMPASASVTRHLRQCETCAEVIDRLQPGRTQNLRNGTPRAKEDAKAVPPPRPSDAEVPPLDFLAPPQTADELGWLGGYRVRKVLGRGGMGLVFEAE